MSKLANVYRPKRFQDIVGQETETAVLKAILSKGWQVSALLLAGPFGTGKTTLARLTARAILCKDRQGIEPCNQCDSCKAMDEDNHTCYLELDAASQGLVGDVRSMKEEIMYRSTGTMKILCYDESHMLSTQAQNAMLQILEEGCQGVMFMFATTERAQMLPTIRSRCVELNLKLLTAGQVIFRLQQVCEQEKIEHEERALKVIGTYVRGHMRDALILLEQIAKLSGQVTEEGVRTYLRLDQYVEIYNFLTVQDRKEGFAKLETLLCNYAASELTEIIGQVLINAYKLKLGVSDFTQVDKQWLQKVLEIQGTNLLDKAERLLSLNTDFASINYALAAMGRIMFEEENQEDRRLTAVANTIPNPPTLLMRKPKTEEKLGS